MNRTEHYARIVRSINDHEPMDVVADELAGLWEVIDDAGSAEADGLWRLVNRVQVAELSREAALADNARLAARATAAELSAEASTRAALAAEDRNAGLVDRLTRIHRAVTEPEAIEKIVVILAEPEPGEAASSRLTPGEVSSLERRVVQAGAIRWLAGNETNESGEGPRFADLLELADRVERGEAEIP